MYIHFKNTKNTRDLGGIAVDLLHCIQYKRIIRSDVPILLTETEINYLLKNNICTVIDLRDTLHTKLSPTCLQLHPDFAWHNVPLQNEKYKINSEEDLIHVYMEFVRNYNAMKEIFKIVLNTDTGIFIHCQEGKDRTGVVCALLLLIAGVSYEDIVVDYQCTEIYMNEYIAQILEAFPEFPEYRYATKSRYMVSFLDKFNKTYGNVKAYLHEIGLSDVEIKNIKHKLIGRLN